LQGALRVSGATPGGDLSLGGLLGELDFLIAGLLEAIASTDQ
jgi:hypothetical protein